MIAAVKRPRTFAGPDEQRFCIKSFAFIRTIVRLELFGGCGKTSPRLEVSFSGRIINDRPFLHRVKCGLTTFITHLYIYI